MPAYLSSRLARVCSAKTSSEKTIILSPRASCSRMRNSQYIHYKQGISQPSPMPMPTRKPLPNPHLDRIADTQLELETMRMVLLAILGIELRRHLAPHLTALEAAIMTPRGSHTRLLRWQEVASHTCTRAICPSSCKSIQFASYSLGPTRKRRSCSNSWSSQQPVRCCA